MFKFEEKCGSKCLVDAKNGDIIHMYTRLSLVIEKNEDDQQMPYTLLKYGEYEAMKSFIEVNKAKLETAGLKDWADNIFLLEEDPSRPWSVDDLQRAIDCTGAIKFIVEKANAIDVEATVIE